jgi:hypothetical protein
MQFQWLPTLWQYQCQHQWKLLLLLPREKVEAIIMIVKPSGQRTFGKKLA